MMLTVGKAAAELGLSTNGVLKLIKTSELPAINVAAFKEGRPSYRIAEDALEAFKQERSSISPSATA